MNRYIAVLVPLQNGGWRAYIPDLVGCGREADDQAAALDAVTRCAKEWLAKLPNNHVIPLPRGTEQIRADQPWTEQRLVDWAKAVLKVVQL